LSFIYIEKYFDIAEFEKAPIKRVIKYEFKPTNSLLKQGTAYFLKKNKVVVNNSSFGFGKSETYEYDQIRKMDTYFRNYDRNGIEDDFMSLYFLEDETGELYTRNVLTLVSILEKVGGIF